MFPAYSPVGSRDCVNINITDDDYVEYDEDFNAYINSMHPVIFDIDYKTIVIINDDCKCKLPG